MQQSSLGHSGLRAWALVIAAATLAAMASSAHAEEVVNAAAGSSPEAGATLEVREGLVDGPSIWQVLSAQYELPTTEPPDPFISGLRDAPAQLTLRDAVLTAVQNNPAVIAESLSPLAQETGILEAQAQFDPILGGDVGLGRNANPVSNVLNASSEGSLRVTQTNANWDFGLSKALRSGAAFSLDWDNARSTNDARLGLLDAPFQLFNPQLVPQLTASLNQPLLRGFGLYFTSLRIRIAESATDAAIENYRAAVANFIRGVIANYWAVVGLEERLDVLNGSLELAEKTVRDNRTRVDVGVLPPVAVLESEAEAARRKEEVIVATNDLSQARLQLRTQVYLPSDNPFLPRAVQPIDRPTDDKIDVMVEEALQIAMEKRPEIQAAKLQYKGRELNTALNENGVLPKLDLFGSLGVNGLAGSNTTDVVEYFEGNYGDSLETMVDGRFYSYQAGVRIEIPIGNAGAKARATRARVEEQQTFTRYRQTVADVSLEVGRAVSDVLSDEKRIETTRVARELSEQNLRNQTKRYEVGMVTTTDLLKFQNDLAAAKVSHIQAMIEYNISQAELERAQGTILSRFNVTIEPRGETETPWWATF
ncbi:MAG: TolC family protein [Candidatus Binatia bacterium]|nr:TolC family protein [Candidatus Binatia bacterium]